MIRIVLKLNLNSIFTTAKVRNIPTPILTASIKVVLGILVIWSAKTLKSGSAKVIIIPIIRVISNIKIVFLL